MEVSDILALAKAGFTAEQISAFSQQTPAPEPEPAPAPAPAPESGDDLRAAIADLKSLIITSNLTGAAQPPVQSVDEILAQVINPPRKEEE